MGSECVLTANAERLLLSSSISVRDDGGRTPHKGARVVATVVQWIVDFGSRVRSRRGGRLIIVRRAKSSLPDRASSRHSVRRGIVPTSCIIETRARPAPPSR